MKIRYCKRRCASPPEGRRQEWHEFQVVDGRRVVGRYDLLAQALRAYPDATPDQSCK